jgi:hypothetical protein
VPVELPAQKTPATTEQIVEALWKAWMGYFGSIPKKESIWVVAAQWALETGWGNEMWDWNMGNVKSRDGDGYDFQFYGCGEEISLAEANRWKAKDPTLVTVKRIYENKDGPKASVWVDPPHWACRFRAFHSLVEGATDYLGLLVKRFSIAWEGVERGDPALFGHLLKQQNYYTDDEAHYTKTLTGTFKMMSKLAIDYDSLPVLTENEKETLSNLVGLTLQTSIDDVVFGRPQDPDDEPNA